MFRLLFKIVSLTTIVIVIIVVLAIWKGGEPFRWIGEKIEIVGKAIEELGDRIDRIKRGGEKAGKELIELKEALTTHKTINKNNQKGENGGINKSQKPE